jgi:uncharacterized protein
MLIDYSVENFRSIAEPINLTMLPAKGSSKPGNLIEIDNNKNVKKLLKSSIIFGANASGKTNLVFAISVMRNLVINSKNFDAGEKIISYLPFILDNTHPNRPTSFKIHFIKNDTEFKYSFSFISDKITNEELSFFKGKKEYNIFKRQNNEFVAFQDKDELISLFKNTGENVLFLSKANNEYQDFRPVFEWFNNDIIAIGSSVNPFMLMLSPQFTIDYMNKSADNKRKILNFLHHADFDIFDISGKNIQIGSPKTFENFRSFFTSFASDLKKEQLITSKDVSINFEKMPFAKVSLSEFKTIRKKIDETEIIEDFIAFESAGTNQFFNLAGLWLDSLEQESKLLIIDEFDMRLHPDLQDFLIRIFHDPEINQKKSQLIFTSHNTKLLNKEIFRREQILFTEKNATTKSTNLYSLYDYEDRQDRSIEKNYYLGRYGGLPDLTYGKI